MLATSPTCPGSEYRCDTCQQVYTDHVVTGLRQELEEMIDMTEKYDCPGLEFLLQVIPDLHLKKINISINSIIDV